jgi:hypothetical protein
MKNIQIIKFLFAAVIMLVLAAGLSVNAQGKGKGKSSWGGGKSSSRIWDRTSKRRNGPYYGYRNYGQYRRTQVGNRRYRMVRRSSWLNGDRVTRWVRMYY